jgi:hypothetical protein
MAKTLMILLVFAAMTGKFKAGDRVLTPYGGKSYKATVVALNKNQYQIKYDSDNSLQWRNEDKLEALTPDNEKDAVGAPPPPAKAAETEFKPDDKVWIDVPGQTQGKAVGTVWKNNSVECCGYYEVNVRTEAGSKMVRTTPQQIVGRWDASQMKYKVGDKVTLRGQWLKGYVKTVDAGW